MNLSPNTLQATERRSRSPTPRLKKVQNLAPEKPKLARSRSPTPNPRDRIRSRSGTPSSAKVKQKAEAKREKERSFIASNKDLTMHVDDDGCVITRSRSPSVGKRSRHNSQSSHRLSGELSKQISEQLTIRAAESPPKKSDESPSEGGCGKPQTEYGGVDYSPTHRVSDNFVGTTQYHLLNTNTVVDDTRRSPSPCFERGGIDTTPACRVSENFVGTNQYPLLNTSPPKAVDQLVDNASHNPKIQKDRSGVDTTPVSKVSDNFVKGCRSRKSSASVNDLDLITKKEQNDSGSEVSDEGYKSLGLVSTPPASSHQTTVPPLTGKCYLSLYMYVVRYYYYLPFINVSTRVPYLISAVVETCKLNEVPTIYVHIDYRYTYAYTHSVVHVLVCDETFHFALSPIGT